MTDEQKLPKREKYKRVYESEFLSVDEQIKRVKEELTKLPKGEKWGQVKDGEDNPST